MPLPSPQRRKAAIRFARKRFPRLCLWTTPEIIKRWADEAPLPADVLRDVILKIESRSRYFPPREHGLARWWQDAKAEKATNIQAVSIQ